jgi:hypothetical protein
MQLIQKVDMPRMHCVGLIACIRMKKAVIPIFVFKIPVVTTKMLIDVQS